MATFAATLPDLGAYEVRVARALVRAGVEQGQRRAAARTRALLKQMSLRAPPASANGRVGAVDRGTFMRSWVVRTRGRVTTVENVAPHAVFVEYGRKPGKPPPTAAILPWVRRRLGLRGKAAQSAAFLIARAIGLRGLRGRKILDRAWSTIQMIHAAEIQRAIDAAVSRESRA